VVCFNKVIIQAKKGQVSAPCDSLKIGHQSIVNFFLGSDFLATGADSTTGAGAGASSAAGDGAGSAAGADVGS
jgi:hypothetical protein